MTDSSILGFTLQVLMGFIAIMNPIGNVPIFVSLVEGYDYPTKKMVARKSTTTAFIIVTVFTIGGNIIFRLFGITLPAFRIAGGIFVFLIAYHLIRGKKSHQHYPSEEEKAEDDPEGLAITPLATPILAGPGTISTALSFVGNRTNPYHIAIIILIFFLICLVTYIAFIYGELLMEKLSPSLIGTITRLMGLILAVVAVQMIIEGICGAFLDYLPRYINLLNLSPKN